jgi:hypothetical protein
MTQSAGPGSATGAPTAGPTAAPALIAPNQFHLQGGGITVTYFPQGFGPIHPGGAARLIYQDATRSLNLTGADVRQVQVPNGLGTVVTVTIVQTVDVGDTTFSVLIPEVVVPAHPASSTPVTTVGITTIHRIFAGAIGHAQRETYTTTCLSGTAATGILPV